MIDIEKEYSPSQWTKRLPSAEVVENHLQVSKNDTKIARETIPHLLDLSYGESPREKFDFYGIHLPKESPIFVYIHGGYWQALTKEHSGYAIPALVKAGFKVCVVDYDLCPSVTLAFIVEQIRRSIKCMLQFALNDSAKFVSFGGHSAGAHLIAAALDREFCASIPLRLVKSLFLISGVYNLTTLRLTKEVNKDNLLSLNDENVLKLSPIYFDYSHLKGVETFVFVGENDSRTFRYQSEDFARLLKDNGCGVECKIVSDLDHFDIVEKLKDENYEITKTILKDLQ